LNTQTVASTTNTTQPSFHPLVAIFPEMEEPAFADFVADIKAHGVREPITLYKNHILDGRNRWLACQQLNIPCPQRAYEGKESDLLAFVVSKNLHRRQMSESQRAIVAARIANMRQGARTDLQPKPNLAEVSTHDAGTLLNVSTGSVKNAKTVLAKAEPEVTRAVERGRLAVSAAAKIAGHPPEVQRLAVAQIDQGSKGAAVVRALPAPVGKARKDADRTTHGDAIDAPPIHQWVRKQLLDFDTTGALSLDPAKILAQMSPDERRDVYRVAKLVIPWLQSMIGECKKVQKAARTDKMAQSDRRQMPLPGTELEQERTPLAPKTETAETTAQTLRRA